MQVQLAANDPAAVRVARRATTQAVRAWAPRPGVAEDVCLVVSELVTNALLHGRSDAVLRVLQQHDSIRVEVQDEDTRLPLPSAPDQQALGGRGLALVAALATLWGTERTDSGKTVWAEFDLRERRST
jgi:two-component sensor histidine kinase